jgi:hypothetical protein
MRDTGFPWADAENDFQRARRRQVLATLVRRLRRQPPGSDQLLRLDEVTGALGWRGERQLGLRTIRLDTIAGTVDSGHDFDRHFRPTSGRVRERWVQLALAQRRGATIPPIEVYRVGDLHFVSDGHHRVSIAAATGQQSIDAYVTEILTAVRPTGHHAPGATSNSRRRPAYGLIEGHSRLMRTQHTSVSGDRGAARNRVRSGRPDAALSHPVYPTLAPSSGAARRARVGRRRPARVMAMATCVR